MFLFLIVLLICKTIIAESYNADEDSITDELFCNKCQNDDILFCNWFCVFENETRAMLSTTEETYSEPSKSREEYSIFLFDKIYCKKCDNSEFDDNFFCNWFCVFENEISTTEKTNKDKSEGKEEDLITEIVFCEKCQDNEYDDTFFCNWFCIFENELKAKLSTTEETTSEQYKSREEYSNFLFVSKSDKIYCKKCDNSEFDDNFFCNWFCVFQNEISTTEKTSGAKSECSEENLITGIVSCKKCHDNEYDDTFFCNWFCIFDNEISTTEKANSVSDKSEGKEEDLITGIVFCKKCHDNEYDDTFFCNWFCVFENELSTSEETSDKFEGEEEDLVTGKVFCKKCHDNKYDDQFFCNWFCIFENELSTTEETSEKSDGETEDLVTGIVFCKKCHNKEYDDTFFCNWFCVFENELSTSEETSVSDKSESKEEDLITGKVFCKKCHDNEYDNTFFCNWFCVFENEMKATHKAFSTTEIAIYKTASTNNDKFGSKEDLTTGQVFDEKRFYDNDTILTTTLFTTNLEKTTYDTSEGEEDILLTGKVFCKKCHDNGYDETFFCNWFCVFENEIKATDKAFSTTMIAISNRESTKTDEFDSKGKDLTIVFEGKRFYDNDTFSITTLFTNNIEKTTNDTFDSKKEDSISDEITSAFDDDKTFTTTAILTTKNKKEKLCIKCFNFGVDVDFYCNWFCAFEYETLYIAQIRTIETSSDEFASEEKDLTPVGQVFEETIFYDNDTVFTTTLFTNNIEETIYGTFDSKKEDLMRDEKIRSTFDDDKTFTTTAILTTKNKKEKLCIKCFNFGVDVEFYCNWFCAFEYETLYIAPIRTIETTPESFEEDDDYQLVMMSTSMCKKCNDDEISDEFHCNWYCAFEDEIIY